MFYRPSSCSLVPSHYHTWDTQHIPLLLHHLMQRLVYKSIVFEDTVLVMMGQNI